eukprot:COSAG04_NODE_4429_length_2100_cov_1.210395_1_plen_358_part_00
MALCSGDRPATGQRPRRRRRALGLLLGALVLLSAALPADSKGSKGSGERSKGEKSKSSGEKGGGDSKESKGGASKGGSTCEGGMGTCPGQEVGPGPEGASKYAEIHLAVTRGNLEKLKELLAAGVDVDLRTEEGFTTLHIAVARSQPDIVQLLLEAGSDVSIGDKMAEHTPLHLACVAGNVQVVQLLLEYGANAEQVDKAGFYPFHHAVAHKNKEVVEFLLTRGGFDANIASHKDGVTALHMAAEFNHLDIMQLLLTHNAAVDQPDSNQLTALHRATMADNRVAAQVLLQWGADVLAENSELRTPLKLAQSMAHNRTVEVLQQHAREEAEMMMTVRAELTEKRKQQTMAPAGTTVVA